jgi:error-prone DNA polymerase
MGFYKPAEIVRDAIEHGVPVLPPDANWSCWDNTLQRGPTGSLCVRLGFRQIDSFREDWATAIENARGYGYTSFEALWRRAELGKPALVMLADAGALQSVGMDRREGLWAVRRLPDDIALPLFQAARAADLAVEVIAPLPVMPLSEQVMADYQRLQLSLRGHPMQFLRDRYKAEGISSCGEVSNGRDGKRVRTAGVILVRQMPGTAGVVFITLADEGGMANVVVWPSVFERFRPEVMGSRVLMVEGTLQRSPENVVHVIAERLFDRTADIDELSDDVFGTPSDMPDTGGMHRHPRQVRVIPKSRDFH